MVKIGANGFEFDNMHSYGPLSKTSSPEDEITCSYKRFMINISYSSSSLPTNGVHRIKVNNTKVDAQDSIIINVMNNHPKVIVSPGNIVDNVFYINVLNLGGTISSGTVDISVLIIT